MTNHLSHLAIDGGGTHCRFVLTHGGRRHEFSGGSANVSTDFTAAVDVLKSGALTLAEQARLTADELFTIPTFAGVAGLTGPAMVERLTRALPFKRAQYTDDRLAALRGALGSGEGAIAHCGTGSFFGAHVDGQQKFVGGWGAVLGDEASAQWVGKRALALTLLCEDGRTSPSSLTKTLLERFEGPVGIVQFASSADPADFGDLAPLVTSADLSGDHVARQVMTEAANHVVAALTHVGWRDGLTVCLSGGIAPFYAPHLPANFRAEISAPQDTPIEGAVALARDHAEQCLQ